jgi:hypothetical protein
MFEYNDLRQGPTVGIGMLLLKAVYLLARFLLTTYGRRWPSTTPLESARKGKDMTTSQQGQTTIIYDVHCSAGR